MWHIYRGLQKRRFSVAFRLFTPFLLAAVGFLCFFGKILTTSSRIHTRYIRNDNRSNVNETSIVQHSHSPNLLDSTDGNSTVILPLTEVKGFIGTDLISLKPFEFLSNYKNPCWTTKETRPPISCLPYFFIVGVQKAGTSDIFKRLQNHPEIIPTSVKEPLWLTWHRFEPGKESINYYIDHHFRRVASKIYESKNATDYHGKITGDCSVNTFSNNSNWQLLTKSNRFGEPMYTNADYVYHMNPHARIIVVLREPVNRLYSDFLYFNKKNDTQASFHNTAIRKIGEFQKCLQTRTLRACVYDQAVCEQGPLQMHLMTGIYHVHLQEFLRVFPLSRILVLNFEEYTVDPESTLKKLCQFLGISSTVEELYMPPSAIANARKKVDKRKGGMWKITRTLLQDFYRPFNDALNSILKYDSVVNYNDMYE